MKRTKEQFFEELYEARRHVSWREQEELDRQMFSDWYHEMEVGDHAHVCQWSDVDPCTIIAKTATTLTVRYDKAERDPAYTPEWIPGGFSAICTNQDDQQWVISEDEDGRVEVFRWSKKYNQYRNTAGERLYPEWRKFYDYNF